jgi:hypothetical protein
MIFGVNEVAPVEESELYVTIILMTISAMLNAVIFGEMAVLVQEMDKKDIDQQEYLDNANTAMFSLEIPENIQDEVRQFLIEVQDYKNQQKEMKDFIENISPRLCKMVNKYIFFVMINLNQYILKMMENQEYINFLTSDMMVKKFKKTQDEKHILNYEIFVKKKSLAPYQVNFFDRMVHNMEIHFEEPEAKIVQHNDDIDKNEYMFFIERGEC